MLVNTNLRPGKIGLGIFIALLFHSIQLCAQNESTIIRIDPDQPTGAPVSKLFSSVTYIPLETTKQSEFGRVDQLCVTDSFYIILDKATNFILLFDKAGKFHRKISGGSKNQYGTGARNLAVNNEKGQITFQDAAFKVHAYDITGRQINTYQDTLFFRDLIFLNNNTTIYHTRNYNRKKLKSDTVDYELKLFSGDKKMAAYFPYQPNNKIIKDEDLMGSSEGSLFKSGSDSLAYFIQCYSDRIMGVTREGVSEAFRFVFPADRTLPKDFLTNPSYFGKRFTYIQTEGKRKVHLIGSFQRLQHLLFFKLWCDDLRGPGTGNFIYDLKNGQLIAGEYLRPDESNNFLPITMGSSFATTHYMMHGFLTVDSKAVYTAIASRELFQGRDAIADKKQTFPAALVNYFSTSSPTSNPVIIQLNLK